MFSNAVSQSESPPQKGVGPATSILVSTPSDNPAALKVEVGSPRNNLNNRGPMSPGGKPMIMWKPRQSNGVPIVFVIQYLRDSQVRTALYQELMIYVPFLILFCFFFLAGRNVTDNHFVVNALQRYTMKEPFPSVQSSVQYLKTILQDGSESTLNIPPPKTYNDLRDMNQWLLWFNTIVTPRTWDCANDQVPRSLYTPLGSTFRLGAMRVRALQVRSDTCDLNSHYFTNTSGIGCYGKHKGENELREPRCGLHSNPTNIRSQLYKYEVCESPSAPGAMTTGSLGQYSCGGYVVEIPFNATCASVRQLITTFADPSCPFVETQALRFLTMEWFMYTSPLDTFQSIKLLVEVAPTGGWDVSYQIRSFVVWQTTMIQTIVLDIVVFLYIWYYASKFFRDWYRAYQRTRLLLRYLTDVWHVLEFINVLCFFTVFGLRWYWMYECYVAKVSFPYPPTYPRAFDKIQLVYLMQVYLNALNTLLCFMKLLLYLRMNDRMSILTRSMSACAENISGVLALFCVILLAYAIAGMSVFGSTLEAYHTVNSAFATLLRTLLGQFDYNQMSDVNPLIAPFFFWTFHILVLFLLLNFITAILSDGFSQASRGVAVQPLAEVIVRSLEQIQRFLSLRNLKKMIELSFQGKSRPLLLKKVVVGLEDHLDLLGERDPLAVERIRMHLDDFRSWLPEELCRDLGDFYMQALWEDVEYEYSTAMSSDLTSELDKLKRAITSGVRDLCTPTVRKVEALATSIEDIELLVRTITHRVELQEVKELEQDRVLFGGDRGAAREGQWQERDWRTMYS